MKTSKRDLLANWAKSLTWGMAFLPSRPLILVLNYHRVGDAEACPYDSETFSATSEELDAQVRFLQRHWHIANLDEVTAIVDGKEKLRRGVVLLTFDDGYLDNYESAFPILSSRSVQGVFFLSTSHIGTQTIPWWDTSAYIVKNCVRPRFDLHYHSAVHSIDIATLGKNAAVKRVLKIYKASHDGDSEKFVAALQEACGVSPPNGGQRSFMNWDEVQTMVRGGMAIGSHTHRHEALAKLPPEEQLEELVTSKQIIEQHIQTPVHSVAYPVGLRDTFSEQTRQAVDAARFRLAFSYYGGFNLRGKIDRFDVRRVGVANGTPARFGLQTSVAMLTGKYWI